MDKSKVMRCSGYVNVSRMHVRLNCEPFEEINCLSTLGRKWQLMDVVHRINKG